MRTFFHTGDGRLRAVRLVACICLFGAALMLYGEGWHSLAWVGQLLMALGFLAMSPAEEVSEPGQSKWRSPTYLAGIAIALAGLGLLFARTAIARSDRRLPPAKMFISADTLVILAVCLLAYAVGKVHKRGQTRLK